MLSFDPYDKVQRCYIQRVEKKTFYTFCESILEFHKKSRKTIKRYDFKKVRNLKTVSYIIVARYRENK